MSGPPKGRPRREVIVGLVPPGRQVIEVGCDHGHTAAALGAIATERRVHRLPRRGDLRLVVADGLLPILSCGPTPRMAVIHAPDRPAALRRWCKRNGWRIDAERLAPEGRRFAEVMRVVPGDEPHEGLALAFGPKLTGDPLLPAHTRQLESYWSRVLERVHGRNEAKAAEARAWLEFLAAKLRSLGLEPSGA